MPTRQTAHGKSAISTADPVDGHEIAVSLGSTLRTRRKSDGLTLQQLADRSGLSQPFLGQLENSKAIPRLLALHQIAAALGTRAQILLQPATSVDTSSVRADGRKSYELAPKTSVSFLVEETDNMIETNLITAQPGAESTCELTYEGNEMAVVLDESISVSLRDHEKVELTTDDSYTYPSGTPHESCNIGSETTQCFFITFPPFF